MPIDKQTGNVPIDQEKIKSIIEKRLVQTPPDFKAAFPPVLRQGRIVSAIISRPEYLIVAFLTAEEEKWFSECLSNQADPLVGLISTTPEGAAFKAEKARCTTVRSCSVTNSFGFFLGFDSTILLEDYHQIIQAADIGKVSYRVPLAYIISYGEEIDHATVYEHLDNLVAYSTNMWSEGKWLTVWQGTTESLAPLSFFERTMN